MFAKAFKIACNFVDHSIDRLSIVGWRFDFDPFDDAVEDLLCVHARGVSGGGHISSIFRIEVQGFFKARRQGPGGSYRASLANHTG